MKHRRPSTLVLCCCVDDGPIECRVVANVPASMHGTVMLWHTSQSVPAPSPFKARRTAEAIHPVQGMQSAAWTRDNSRRDASLGPGANLVSLTSEIYLGRFGTWSLLQLANATVVLEKIMV